MKVEAHEAMDQEEFEEMAFTGEFPVGNLQPNTFQTERNLKDTVHVNINHNINHNINEYYDDHEPNDWYEADC